MSNYLTNYHELADMLEACYQSEFSGDKYEPPTNAIAEVQSLAGEVAVEFHECCDRLNINPTLVEKIRGFAATTMGPMVQYLQDYESLSTYQISEFIEHLLVAICSIQTSKDMQKEYDENA